MLLLLLMLMNFFIPCLIHVFFCLFPSHRTSQSGGILSSQLKNANGLVSGTGIELTPPLSGAGHLGSQDIQGLFVSQPHVGYAPHQPQQTTTLAGTQQPLQVVKREPEDLSHHRRLVDNGSPSLDGSIIVSRPQQRHKVGSGHTNSCFLQSVIEKSAKSEMWNLLSRWSLLHRAATIPATLS